MTAKPHILNCLECGAPDPRHNLLCDACQPAYETGRDTADECTCPSCSSDMAVIVPCMGNYILDCRKDGQ